MAVQHTSCRYCWQDIEGFAPYRKGEWRDRGNNTTCPTIAGDRDGLKHAPYRPGRDDSLRVCTRCRGPMDQRTQRAGGEVCWTCSTGEGKGE